MKWKLRRVLVLAGAAVLGLNLYGTGKPAQACDQDFNAMIGTICIFAGNFAPRNYALAQGQLISILSNTALFSILGTTYGGDGQTTFGLPDLRGRVPIGAGNGPGLSNYSLGQKSGAQTVTLNTNQMPAHNHAATATATAVLMGNSGQGNTDTPTGGVPARLPREDLYSTNAPNVNMHADAVDVTVNVTTSNTGGSQSHDIRQPSLALNFIIALVGRFPSRN